MHPPRQISKEEADTFQKQLAQTGLARARFEDGPAATDREHYKVPFEEVLDLVRQRRVFINKVCVTCRHMPLHAVTCRYTHTASSSTRGAAPRFV